MTVSVRYFTDPACPCSWAAELALQTLMVELGEALELEWVMAGLAREFAGRTEGMLRRRTPACERCASG